MECIRTIKGKKETFFEVVEQSILYDVNESSLEENSKVDKIEEGFHYSKMLKGKIGKAGRVLVEITKFIPNTLYSASFTSAQGINLLSYELRDIDDTHFEVIYSEDFTSKSGSKRLNYKLVSRLSRKSSLKRANLILDRIENMMNEKSAIS